MPFAMSFGDVLLIEEGTTLAGMKEQLIALGHTNIRMGAAPKPVPLTVTACPPRELPSVGAMVLTLGSVTDGAGT